MRPMLVSPYQSVDVLASETGRKIPMITVRPRSLHSSAMMVALMIALVTVLSLSSTGNSSVRAAVPVSAPHSAPMGLHVVGRQLLDSSNQPIVLRGVNRSGSEYACIQGWGF